MRRIALAVALTIAATGLTPATSAADDFCPPPRCLDITVPLPDVVRVPDARVRVLLPAGYDADERSYPVLYLLHGVGDTYRSVTENTDVVALTESVPLIVVMPDAGRSPDAGWYSDWADGSRQWETFHISVLIPYIDRTFRTRGAPGRAVAGLSMGGFGAMSYAGRHPTLFRAAASFSGFVDTMYAAPASGTVMAQTHDQFGTPDARIWGSQTANERRWRAHNPSDLAGRLRGKFLYLASGTGTPGGAEGEDPRVVSGTYPVEHFVFQTNVSFLAALTRAGVAYTPDYYAGGWHGWPYWQRDLHRALPHLLAAVA